MEKSREAKRKQQERLDYLLREFKEDSVRYRDLEEGENYEEKRMLSYEYPYAGGDAAGSAGSTG